MNFNNKKQVYMKNFGVLSESFIQVIEDQFPADIDVKFAKNAILALKKTNPRMLMNYWLIYIYVPNRDQIDRGDYHFLDNIEKYNKLLDECEYGSSVKESLLRLKTPVYKLDPEHLSMWMDYVLKMSKLSFLYFS